MSIAAKSSLPCAGYLCSAAFKALDLKTPVRLPLFSTVSIKASIAYYEASVVTTIGRLGSRCLSPGVFTVAFLSALELSLWSVFHSKRFLHRV